ncbi:MAG TPA: nucleoside hydrolase [Candidatus Limnocylindrales bacterium]|nr:nucleoside hydrolase [Candidatus Limnocylindrales bacterium]
MKRVLIDCDPGMDDALALILAFRSPELQVEAITAATGNLPADRTSANVRRVLDLLGAPDIAVAQGPLSPLVRPYPSDPFSHGADGLGDTGLPASPRRLDPHPAPNLIIDTIRAHPGEVTIIATAPLTNLALALQQAPDLVGKVERVVAIAGAFGFNEYAARYATGDNPVSEWNVYVDPDAARIVFRSGLPITAIGVDVWGRPDLNFSPAQLDALRAADTPTARFTLGLVAFVEGRHYGSYTVQIDAMAVAAVIDPTLFTTERLRVAVETTSPLTLGQTVVDRRVHHAWTDLPEIEAACDVDFRRYLDLLVAALERAA